MTDDPLAPGAPRGPSGLIGALRRQRAAARWRRRAETADALSPDALVALAPQARALADQAQAVLAAAEGALRPSEPPPAPDGSEWAWRPGPWSTAIRPAAVAGVPGHLTLAPGATLFHDCPLGEITARQVAGPRAAPYALAIDALGFDGTFLSLALDLPAEAGLRRGQIVGLTGWIEMERPAEVFARLNLRQGPNTDQLVSELRAGDRPDSPVTAAFDLGFHDVRPNRLEAAWIDLIVDSPRMNRIEIADLVVSRRPRADL